MSNVSNSSLDHDIVCSSGTESSDKSPPTPVYYSLYTVIALIGIAANAALLFVYIKRKRPVLGDRGSFVFLRLVLSGVDFNLSIMLTVDLGLKFYENKVGVIGIGNEYFYTLRNLHLGYESFGLVFIALDRLIAVRAPTSRLWSTRLVVVMYFAVMGLVMVSDLAVKSVLLLHPSCTHRRLIYAVYDICYGVVALVTLVTTYVSYIATFVSFSCHVRRQNSCRIGAVSSNQSSAVSYNLANVKMAQILLTITLIYTVSIVPVFAYNVGVISFPGYTVYYLFYVNVLANPVIYMATNNAIKTYLKSSLPCVH